MAGSESATGNYALLDCAKWLQFRESVADGAGCLMPEAVDPVPPSEILDQPFADDGRVANACRKAAFHQVNSF